MRTFVLIFFFFLLLLISWHFWFGLPKYNNVRIQANNSDIYYYKNHYREYHLIFLSCVCACVYGIYEQRVSPIHKRHSMYSNIASSRHLWFHQTKQTGTHFLELYYISLVDRNVQLAAAFNRPSIILNSSHIVQYI